MDVFDLDRALLADYARFARSFTQIRAADIRQQVEEIYASNRFWPDPLISINDVETSTVQIPDGPKMSSFALPYFFDENDSLRGAKDAA